MVAVETPAGVVQHHVDQVVHHDEDTSGTTSLEATASEQLDGRPNIVTSRHRRVHAQHGHGGEKSIEHEFAAEQLPAVYQSDVPTLPPKQVPVVETTAKTTRSYCCSCYHLTHPMLPQPYEVTDDQAIESIGYVVMFK